MTDDGYSTAFERIVDVENIDDDVVGLLAYAYYKRDKRELTLSGALNAEELAHHHKSLTNHLIAQYKGSAVLRLENFAAEVLSGARPQIAEETRTEAIQTAEANIIAAVQSSSVWWHAVVWNVIAWLLTLAITFLVLTTAGTIRIG